MKTAANQLDFERAIQLREQVSNLTKQLERLKKKKSRKWRIILQNFVV